MFPSSTAHDDTFWEGHFGAVVSAALLRVKCEAKPAENDEFADVVENTLSKDALQDLTKIIQELNIEHKSDLEALQRTIGKLFFFPNNTMHV